MDAKVGDRLVIKGHHIGDADREAVVLEVLGRPGDAHFKVRWNDGHESVFFPSSDCTVAPTSAGGGHG